MTKFTASDDLGEMTFESPMDHEEEYKFWRLCHLLSAWALGITAILSAAEGHLFSHLWLVVILCGAVGFGLFFSYAAKLMLQSAFAQLGIREKFAGLMLMIAVGFVPRLVGIREPTAPWMVFLILFAFLSYNPLSYGRYYLITLIIVCRQVLMGPFISSVILLLFAATLFLTFWLEFVAFRLQAYGKGRPINALNLLMGVLPNFFTSLGVSLGAYLILWPTLMGSTKMPVLNRQVGNGQLQLSELNLGNLLYDAIVVIVSIVGLILLMQWIEKHFRFSKGGPQEPEMPLGAAFEGRYSPATSAADSLHELPETEARALILQRFRQYVSTLTGFGWARTEDETPREYMQRAAYKLLSVDRDLDPRLAALYNKACYSAEAITPEDANLFVSLAGQTEQELTAEILRLKERADFLNDLKRQQDAQNS